MRRSEEKIPLNPTAIRSRSQSPRPAAHNSDRVAVLFVILIAVGVAFLIVRSRSRPRPEVAGARDVAMATDLALLASASRDGETKIEILGIGDGTGSDTSAAIALKSEVELPEEKILSAAMESGMFFLPLDLKNGSSLKINLVAQGGADVGIVNGILRDISERRLGRVIMSLEGLASIEGIGKGRQKNLPTAGAGSGRSPQQLLTEGEISNGTRLSFAVPPLSQSAQAGIFICGDQTASGTCLGKEPFTAKGILADRYTSSYNPAGEFVFPARIYYFAYVVLTPVGIFVMSQVGQGSESYGAIRKFLAALSVQDSGALAQVQALNAKSQSQQPAILEGERQGGLQIVLSRGLQ